MFFESLDGASVEHAPCNLSKAMAQAVCGEMNPGDFVSKYNNSVGGGKSKERSGPTP